MQLIYLTYIVPGSILVPLLFFLLRYRIAPAILKTLFWYLVFAAIVNLAANMLAARSQPNLWLLHVYTIIEAVLLLYFFLRLLPNGTVKKTLPVLMILFPLYGIINLLLFHATSKFNTYPRSVEALLFIALSIYYWSTHAEAEEEYTSWTDNPYNWIVSGIILYFSSSFFLFLFSNFLLVNITSQAVTNIWQWAWTIHATLLMIMYLLFAGGFSRCR